jgi:hypothetical protein
MKMSENDSSSSSSEEEDLEGSRKPPSHGRRSGSLTGSSENLTTAGGYIAKIEKDLSKILKKMKIITNYQ